MEKSRAENTVQSHGGREHDSEDVSRLGMSTDAAAVRDAGVRARDRRQEYQFLPGTLLAFWVGERKEGLPHG